MRLKQLIRKMSYNTAVKVLKIVKTEQSDSEKEFQCIDVGTYSRYSRVPEEIWTASIYEIMPGTEDTLLVLIEGVSNED